MSIVRELTVGTFTPSLVIELARADGRFADAGLEVIEVAVTSSPQQFRALASGEYDVIFTNPDNVIAYHFLRDNPLGENLSLRVIAGIDRGLGLGLFRGAHVGKSLPAGLLGVDVATSGFAFVAYELLARCGLSMSDMTVENLGATPRRAEALIRGACDYTILNAGNDLRALSQGCSLVAPVVEIGPYLATALVALHTDDVEVRAVQNQFRDALGATITSILSGYRDDDVVAALQSLLGMTPEGALEHLRCMKDPATGLVADLGVDTASLTTIVSLRTRHRPSEELTTVLESLGDFVDADVLR